MMNGEKFLQEMQNGLLEILRPYEKRLNQQRKKAEFLNGCIRHIGRDDFIQLDELLKTKIAGELAEEECLAGCGEYLERLRTYAAGKVEQYRLQFVEDLTERAREADLPLEVDFPRLVSLRGIEGAVDFSRRVTTINKMTLKSIHPGKIVAAFLKEKRELYDRPFVPRAFIDGLQQVYMARLHREGLSPGDPVPIQQFYFDYVMSLQSKSFLQDMAKGRFRGYSLDQFAVDLWRLFQSETGGTSDGYAMQLRAGRNNSLWLIDSAGEKRQITGISFKKVDA